MLGTLTAVLGPSADTIHIASWIYTAMLMSALILSVHISLQLIAAFGLPIGKSVAMAGAVVSAVLYLASDVCRHLAGNFVAEIPALFLLTGCLVTLLASNARRMAGLGVVSGVLAFLLYVVKMDAIWSYVTFLCLLAFASRLWIRDRLWWPAQVYSGLTSAALFVCYAWWFWPLPDPRLIVLFERAHDEVGRNTVFPMKLWVAAGAMLWIGFALALRYAWREKVMWFTAIWLLLFFLPYTPSSLESRPMQVRMFALLMPPLLLASTIGWAMFFEQWRQRGTSPAMPWLLGSVVLGGVVLSQAESYAFVRQFPGMWRLQYVKEWLSPPQYERLSYPLADIERVANFVYADSVPKLLFIDKPKNWELFSIMAYLRPRRSDATPARLVSERETICGSAQDLRSEKVIFCPTPLEPDAIERLKGSAQVLYLQRSDSVSGVDLAAQQTAVFHSGALTLNAANSVNAR